MISTRELAYVMAEAQDPFQEMAITARKKGLVTVSAFALKEADRVALEAASGWLNRQRQEVMGVLVVEAVQSEQLHYVEWATRDDFIKMAAFTGYKKSLTTRTWNALAELPQRKLEGLGIVRSGETLPKVSYEERNNFITLNLESVATAVEALKARAAADTEFSWTSVLGPNTGERSIDLLGDIALFNKKLAGDSGAFTGDDNF